MPHDGDDVAGDAIRVDVVGYTVGDGVGADVVVETVGVKVGGDTVSDAAGVDVMAMPSVSRCPAIPLESTWLATPCEPTHSTLAAIRSGTTWPATPSGSMSSATR